MSETNQTETAETTAAPETDAREVAIWRAFLASMERLISGEVKRTDMLRLAYLLIHQFVAQSFVAEERADEETAPGKFSPAGTRASMAFLKALDRDPSIRGAQMFTGAAQFLLNLAAGVDKAMGRPAHDPSEAVVEASRLLAADQERVPHLIVSEPTPEAIVAAAAQQISRLTGQPVKIMDLEEQEAARVALERIDLRRKQRQRSVN